MNKEDIEKIRYEWLAALKGDEMDKCDWGLDYATVLLNEVERLQGSIKTCDDQLTAGWIPEAHGPYRAIERYDIQAVNWVHKTLSQAIEGE